MMNDIARQQRANGIKPADSLSPATLAELQSIREQMQREHLTQTHGKALGSNTFQNMATNSLVGKVAGGLGNALVSTGAGAGLDLLLNGGVLTGGALGALASHGMKNFSAMQTAKAASRAEVGRQMLMKELRDRLLNVNNKGVQALSNE
jgi:hypothetical protein